VDSIDSTANDSGSFTIERPENIEANVDNLPVTEKEDVTLSLQSGQEIEASTNRWVPLYSLLVPGLAEYKMGKKSLGKSLMLADGVLWAGFGTAYLIRALTKNDLRAVLYTYGDCDGVKTPSHRTAWDLTDTELELPLYADSSAFYDERIYKPSRDPSMVKADFYWQWDSEAQHQRYYDLWKKMNSAKVASYYFLGGALINRIGSAVYARFLSKNSGVKHAEKSTLSFDAYPATTTGGNDVLKLSLRF